MDSYPDGNEHESRAKRIKLDLSDSNIGELCNEDGFSCFSTRVADPIDINEGVLTDCDSGYEASTLESIPTPSHHTPSPTESYLQTPTHTVDQLDTSQDSLEVDDENSSSESNISDISILSDICADDWTPNGCMIWIQKQMEIGANPRKYLHDFGVDLDQIPQYMDDLTLWKILMNLIMEPPRRHKLRHVNKLDDVVRLLKGAQNIIVLTGAGVSVSCGIPDFRSRDGIYSRLAVDFPNLPSPQAMFDINYFSQDPRPFFKFARDIYPGKFQPSPCHRFIKLLEKHNKLLRNYTQNIDTLEKEANIEHVIECHGSFATATCTRCNYKSTAEAIRNTVLAQKIPLCEKCHPGKESSVSTDEQGMESTTDFTELVTSGIMKPDIVFFGEDLPDTFHEAMSEDKNKCDLLLVIGSSLKVRPVALIPSSLPTNVPQILINREPLPQCHFDVELLGDCDVVVNHLCQLLGSTWEEGIYNPQTLREAPLLSPPTDFYNETEPNCTVDTKLILSDKDACKCNNTSTNSSSLTLDDIKETICTCSNSKQMSINILNKEYTSKERHMSIDSARDSGIGENSNFTDLEAGEEASKKEEAFEGTSSDMRGFWQPKIKMSLADRLMKDTFHLIKPSRYIFPGAEVFYDPDEKFLLDESSLDNNSDDSQEAN